MPDAGQKKEFAEPEFFALKTEALDEKLAAQQQRVSALVKDEGDAGDRRYVLHRTFTRGGFKWQV
jgi:hypothetical protein